jgi:hypothetical protein
MASVIVFLLVIAAMSRMAPHVVAVVACISGSVATLTHPAAVYLAVASLAVLVITAGSAVVVRSLRASGGRFLMVAEVTA